MKSIFQLYSEPTPELLIIQSTRVVFQTLDPSVQLCDPDVSVLFKSTILIWQLHCKVVLHYGFPLSAVDD